MNPVVHFELPAEDRQRMAKFYSTVFNWDTQLMGEDMGNYVLATTTDTDDKRVPRTPGAINGGFFPKTSDNPMKHPSLTIASKDIKADMEKVKKAGGKVHGEPVEIPGIGQYVAFTDTEGNMLSMLQPKGM